MKWTIPSDEEVRASEPIPVRTARAVSDTFDKCIVVIAAFDERAVLQIATYGRTEEDKYQAARLGPIVARAAGAEPAEGVTHYDFRVERLVKAARAVLAKDTVDTRYARGAEALFELQASLAAFPEGT